MATFESIHIYGINTEFEIYGRTGSVVPAQDEIIYDIKDAKRPIHVNGLLPEDFGLFVEVADDEDTETIPYLVTYQNSDSYIIVPESLINSDIRSYGTAELTMLLRGVSDSELGQFGIDALAKRLEKLFGKIK